MDKPKMEGQVLIEKQFSFNIKKLIKKTIIWPGLNGMDLAKEVSTKKNYKWKDFKTWSKEEGYKKNKKKL